MNILKSKLFHSIGIYTVSSVINSAIPFLLLPILTDYLSTADYGILTNFNSLIGILIPILSMNLMTSLQVVYVKNKEQLGAFISTGTIVMLVLTALFSGVLFLYRYQIMMITGVPESFIVFSGVYVLYQNIVEVLLSLWRMDDKAVSFGLFRIIRTVVELSLAVILIVAFNRSFDGSIYAMAVSYGIGAIVALIILFKRGLLKVQFKWAHVLFLFSYGAPLIPHVLSSVVIMYTDKIVITQYLGLSSNGIYSVGFMVGQAIGLLQNSFNQAWVPYVFTGLKSGSEYAKKSIVKWTYIYILGILGITILFYFFTPLIFYFLGDKFQDGISLVLWIALGFAFNGMYKMVSVYFFYLEMTKFIAIISVVTAILNIFLSIWMVPRYGFVGAATSTMIAFFLQFVFTWIWSTRVIDMPWENWKIWKKY